MIFFSCCGCDCSCGEEITYRVASTTTTSTATVEFNNDFGDTERYSSVKLPWVYRFNIKERPSNYFGGGYQNNQYPAYIRAITTDRRLGSIVVTIYVNGKMVRTATNTASDSTTATARFQLDL